LQNNDAFPKWWWYIVAGAMLMSLTMAGWLLFKYTKVILMRFGVPVWLLICLKLEKKMEDRLGKVAREVYGWYTKKMRDQQSGIEYQNSEIQEEDLERCSKGEMKDSEGALKPRRRIWKLGFWKVKMS
jgi:hypothetical protein